MNEQWGCVHSVAFTIIHYHSPSSQLQNQFDRRRSNCEASNRHVKKSSSSSKRPRSISKPVITERRGLWGGSHPAAAEQPPWEPVNGDPRLLFKRRTRRSWTLSSPPRWYLLGPFCQQVRNANSCVPGKCSNARLVRWRRWNSLAIDSVMDFRKVAATNWFNHTHILFYSGMGSVKWP